MLLDPKWNESKVDAIGQVLLDAAAVMERDGWCSGVAVDREKRKCAIGALTEAAWPTFGGLYYQAAYDRLSKYLGTYNIPGWSDAAGGDVVILAMRSAAYAS